MATNGQPAFQQRSAIGRRKMDFAGRSVEWYACAAVIIGSVLSQFVPLCGFYHLCGVASFVLMRKGRMWFQWKHCVYVRPPGHCSGRSISLKRDWVPGPDCVCIISQLCGRIGLRDNHLQGVLL